MLFIIKIIDYLVMKLTESEVKELVKAALREAFINEGFMIKENVTENASEQDLYYASEDVKNFIKQNGSE